MKKSQAKRGFDMEKYRKEAEEMISKCEELVSALSEWEKGTADMCGEDDEICYKPIKETLQKMIAVRDFVHSWNECFLNKSR